jgi:hypothetical protein
MDMKQRKKTVSMGGILPNFLIHTFISAKKKVAASM